MKLWVKFALTFSLLTVVIGAGGYYYFDKYFFNLLKDNAKIFVTRLGESSRGSYAAFTENLKGRARDWSSDPVIRNLAEEIISTGTSADQRKKAQEELGDYLKNKKMPFDLTVSIVDIIDEKEFVVASSHKERIGVNEGEEEEEYHSVAIKDALRADFGEAFVRSSAEKKDEYVDEKMMHVTTRLFSARDEKSASPQPLNAILLLHFRNTQELMYALNGGGFSFSADNQNLKDRYETQAIYVVNEEGEIITLPRENMSEIVIKGKKVAQRFIDACMKNNKDIHGEEYSNYASTPVVGAMMCVLDSRSMIFTEIDTDDLYAPLDSLRRKLMAAILFVLFLVVVTSIFLSRQIMNPLRSVALVAQKIQQGDFTGRISTLASGEIGSVAAMFNEVLDGLERYRKEAAQKTGALADRIASFEKQNKYLEDSKKAMLNLLQDSWELGTNLKKEKERSLSIIRSISEGLFVLDGKKHVILINSAAEKLLKIEGEDAIGKDLGDILSLYRGEYKLDEKTWISIAIQNKEPFIAGATDDMFLESANGMKFPVTIAIAPLMIDNEGGVVVVFRDISEEKALEEAKSNFISIASHQLRTPLTSIRWYSEVLNEESLGSLNPEQKDFVREIHEGSIRLFQTIDTLLAFSRMESGRFQSKPVPLDTEEFTSSIIEELTPLITQKNLTVQFTPPQNPTYVFADKFMLREIITNLLANSIRYTNNGGAITIRCEEKDGKMQFEVTDNGIGIPENQKLKIFSKFFRADNALAKVPDGTGVGLSLVKELVEKIGGDIWFYSTEGKGTSFYFTTPLAVVGTDVEKPSSV